MRGGGGGGGMRMGGGGMRMGGGGIGLGGSRWGGGGSIGGGSRWGGGGNRGGGWIGGGGNRGGGWIGGGGNRWVGGNVGGGYSGRYRSYAWNRLGFVGGGFNNNYYWPARSSWGIGLGGWGGWGAWGGWWPYYSGYGLGWAGGAWPAYYDYAYPGYAGYAGYANYDPSPNVTVVYPQQQQQQAPVYVQPAPSRGVTREYDQYGQEVRRDATTGSPVFLIAFKDNTIRPASAYWVVDRTLHYVTLQHEEKQVSLDAIDRDLSLRLNRERRIDFNLPQ
jgi:hypothetical protein